MGIMPSCPNPFIRAGRTRLNRGPITSAQLYERYVAEVRGGGEEPAPELLEYLWLLAMDPARLLAEDTTACPPWCDGRHDVGDDHVLHAGPEIGSVPAMRETPGWAVRIGALEYVDEPGRLHLRIRLFGDEDERNPLGIDAEFPAEWLPALAAVVGQVDELTSGMQ